MSMSAVPQTTASNCARTLLDLTLAPVEQDTLCIRDDFAEVLFTTDPLYNRDLIKMLSYPILFMLSIPLRWQTIKLFLRYLIYLKCHIISFLFTENNECNSGTHTCEHTCTNTRGSYVCSCNAGYTLSDNGFSCISTLKHDLYYLIFYL